MAVDYIKMAALARTLIGANGRSVTLRQLVTTPANPAKPWRGSTDPDGAGAATTTVQAISVPPGSVRELGLQIDSPALVQSSSSIFIVAPPDPPQDLSVYTELIDDAKVYRIHRADELRPGEVTLLYFLEVGG
jgi:hypothetical protein